MEVVATLVLVSTVLIQGGRKNDGESSGSGEKLGWYPFYSGGGPGSGWSGEAIQWPVMAVGFNATVS
jgi:hypothetical protein